MHKSSGEIGLLVFLIGRDDRIALLSRGGVSLKFVLPNGLYVTWMVNIEKAPLVPWVTVPWNVLHIGGTGPPTFDFQSRPDGYRLQRRGAPCFLLRFKDSIATRV